MNKVDPKFPLSTEKLCVCVMCMCVCTCVCVCVRERERERERWGERENKSGRENMISYFLDSGFS